MSVRWLLEHWLIDLAVSSCRLCSDFLGVYCIVLWLPLHQRFWWWVKCHRAGGGGDCRITTWLVSDTWKGYLLMPKPKGFRISLVRIVWKLSWRRCHPCSVYWVCLSMTCKVIVDAKCLFLRRRVIHVLLHAQVTFFFGVRIGRRLDLHAASWLGSLLFFILGHEFFFLVIPNTNQVEDLIAIFDCEYTHSCLLSFLGSGRVIVLRATFVAWFFNITLYFSVVVITRNKFWMSTVRKLSWWKCLAWNSDLTTMFQL